MENKLKEGVSVKEIEAFARKHRFEVVLCFAFILTWFFSFGFFGARWGIFSVIAGGILGILLPRKERPLTKKAFEFILKQEPITQLVLAGVVLLLSIFIPPLILLVIGLYGGRNVYGELLSIYAEKDKS